MVEECKREEWHSSHKHMTNSCYPNGSQWVCRLGPISNEVSDITWVTIKVCTAVEGVDFRNLVCWAMSLFELNLHFIPLGFVETSWNWNLRVSVSIGGVGSILHLGAHLDITWIGSSSSVGIWMLRCHSPSGSGTVTCNCLRCGQKSSIVLWASACMQSISLMRSSAGQWFSSQRFWISLVIASPSWVCAQEAAM